MYYLHSTEFTPTSHDLWDSDEHQVVPSSDELLSVIYDVFYNIEMGKVFEERLRMQSDARQLDEETVRLLQETYVRGARFAAPNDAGEPRRETSSRRPGGEGYARKREGVYHRAMENAIDKELDAQKKQMALDIQRKRILRPIKVRLQVVHLQRQTQRIHQHQPRSEGAGEK
jgi:hypothetical protein